jgi:hypothetical protein
MDAEIYSIRYDDRAAAALVFKRLCETSEALGLITLGMERAPVRSRRVKNMLRIVAVLPKDKAMNLPSVLRGVKESLREHPLYPHLSFDFCVTPLSHANWDFDSYDDPNYQEVFIRKRKE